MAKENSVQCLLNRFEANWHVQHQSESRRSAPSGPTHMKETTQ